MKMNKKGQFGLIGLYDASNLPTHIPFWKYGKFEWYTNSKGLYIPYYREFNTNNLYPIVNLHIHSKDLISAVSYTDKHIS